MPYVFADASTPFFRLTVPVQAFVTALQLFLRVPTTGRWDVATHDALRSFVKQERASNEIGAWGQDAGKVASNALQLLDPRDDIQFQRVRSLLGTAGLPSDSLTNYRQFRTRELSALLTFADTFTDSVKAAERDPVAMGQPRPGPQPPAFVNGGLIALGTAGIAMLLGIVWIATRPKTALADIDPYDAYRKLRKPLPPQKGGSHGGKKGKKGYDRKRDKQRSRREDA